MATQVQQTYTPAGNVSVTIRDGRVDLITTWRTGDDATKTVRVGVTEPDVR